MSARKLITSYLLHLALISLFLTNSYNLCYYITFSHYLIRISYKIRIIMEYNKNKLKAKAKLICELYVSLVKSKVIRIFDLKI